jgi:hypothetical protein
VVRWGAQDFKLPLTTTFLTWNVTSNLPQQDLKMQAVRENCFLKGCE